MQWNYAYLAIIYQSINICVAVKSDNYIYLIGFQNHQAQLTQLIDPDLQTISFMFSY